MAKEIAALVHQHGGRTYYVGGFVRDSLIHRENKDIDIEVHGITPHCLESILDTLGQRISMGESFGIYNLKGYSLDIAMPRKEQIRGQGHTDFASFTDPFIGTESACRRRDFTFNALIQDVLTDEIIDHFGGVSDLKAGIIRHVDDVTFAEDPLRVLRAAQFAARFDFQIAPETIDLCSRLDLQKIARERIEGELKKALLKSHKPSRFFWCLREMNQLGTWFPEVNALIGIEQNPVYHAEGDVWNHTMLVLDQAAKLRSRVTEPYWFMLSALTHDFGKAVTTAEKNGVIHAYAHEEAGVPIAREFLRRITTENKLTIYVLNQTLLHMKPNAYAAAGSSVKSTNRMYDQSVDPEGLICLAMADHLGRILEEEDLPSEKFLLRRLQIFREYMQRPYVMGKDLIDAGLHPGKEFTQILAYAHKLRLAGVPKDQAMKQTLAFARQFES
ncbi:MAG: HD domain-containing protein [Oscillospiraceae bacterium]|nr:HD domain-containing protein [Oscillospiraceae bacterium]